MTTDEELEKLKSEIITSMAQIEDTHHRVVLSLMIRIMGTQERFTNDIFTKLDVIIQDEGRIKEIVLNGHRGEHTEHHDWVKTQMETQEKSKDEFKNFIKSTLGKVITLGLIFLLGFHARKLFPGLFGGSI